MDKGILGENHKRGVSNSGDIREQIPEFSIPVAMTRRSGNSKTVGIARIVVALALIGALAGAGLSCASKRSPQMAGPPGASVAPQKADQAREAIAVERSGLQSSAPVENLLDASRVREEQMIIWEATCSMKVEDASDAADQFQRLAESTGGFVSAKSMKVDEAGNTRVVMTVRVPSAEFWDTIKGLRGLGKLDSLETTSENVTEEWVDLEARLGIKQLRKQQLEVLLKKAKTIEEIDIRQQQINAVQEEIDRIQGRRRVLQNQVALCTIDATLYEKGLPPLEKIAPFSAKRTTYGAWYALVRALRVLFEILVWVLLPGAVVWVPLLLWVWYRQRRRLMER